LEANIKVEFLEITGIKVDETLLKNSPMLFSATEKTVKILCEQVEKYFKDKKIKVKSEFNLER